MTIWPPQNYAARLCVALAVLACWLTSAYAIPVTITAIAPPGPSPTDYCIGASGDPNDNNINFGTEIVDDYDITPGSTFPIPGSSFQSSQNITHGAIGWVRQDGREEICFYFPNDPVAPGAEFTVVIDVLFVDGSDPNADTGLAAEGEFSYPDGTYSQFLPNTQVFGVPQGVLDQLADPKPVRIWYSNEKVTVFQTIPEPPMGAALMLVGLAALCAPRLQRRRQSRRRICTKTG